MLPRGILAGYSLFVCPVPSSASNIAIYAIEGVKENKGEERKTKLCCALNDDVK